MRVLFGVVLCILIDSKVLGTSTQENSITTFSDFTSTTPFADSCTVLDPPVNVSIVPDKTSANLTWSTNQTDPNCSPTIIDVRCFALPKENNGHIWINSSSSNSTINDINSNVVVYMENLMAFVNYTCSADLSDDYNMSEATEIKFQTKQEVADAPYDMTIQTTTSTNFTVQWKKPINNPGVFITYHVRILSKGPNYFLPSSCKPHSHNDWYETVDESYTFLDAFPDYSYTVTVFLQNSAGNGSKTDINVTTDTAASEAPTGFAWGYSELHIEENLINQSMSWNMPCNTNGKIESFEIVVDGSYTLNHSIRDYNISYISATEDEKYYSIIELMPASSYKIKIRANGINKTGEFFEDSLVTDDNLPGPPIIEDIIQGSHNFTVTWKEPERRAGNITGYTVFIDPLGPMYDIDSTRCSIENQSLTTNLEGYELSYSFMDARPYYEYNVSIVAATSKGNGSSNTTIANTLSATPDAPQDLEFKLLDGNETGSISWRTPCNVNGPIEKFLIIVNESYTEDASKINSSVLWSFYNKSTYTYSLNIPLSESYKYEVSVQVVLKDGYIGLENTTNLTTADGYPGPPIISNISTKNHNSFDIFWDQPITKNGKILEYEIIVNTLGPLYETQCKVDYPTYNYNTSGDVTFFTFKEGQPYYNYNISIKAMTARGWGSSSKFKNGRTASSTPDNVTDISHNMSLPTADEYNAYINITFEPPCKINGPSLYYELKLHGTRENNGPHEYIDSSYINRFDHIQLKPEYTYTFAITTNNGDYRNTSFSTVFEAPSGIPQFSNPIIDLNIDTATSGATIVLEKEYFDVTNGNITYLALILSENNETGGFSSEWDGNTWPNVNKDGYYQLTEDKWYPFTDTDTVTFVIGNQTNCSKYKNNCNKPLESGKDYYLIIRIFTRNFFKNSPTIHFRTEETSKLGVILGVIFGLLIFALVGFAGFFVWRKKLIRLPPTLLARKLSVKTIPDGNTSIPIPKFIQYCKNLENNPEKYTEQYMLLTEKSKEVMSTHTTTFAELTENRRKNRYTNILPYDATRVKLLIDEDDEIGSDYINASYIKGYSGNIEYIATQGPLPTTCRDFWKMVIQENVSIIVMVTQFIEDNKEKCYKYFPNNHESMTIGDDMEVKCSMELHFGTYCVRTIQVKKDTTQVTVTHMQYLDWPDFNVPKGTGTMLQFCHQLRERLKIEGGCVIVHCSAGVGRTGTLIATDILIQSINAGKNIDIYNTVLELRKQRMIMVQAQKQYVYIHNLIRDTLESHSSELNENLEPIYENQSAMQMKTDDDNLINKDKERESQF